MSYELSEFELPALRPGATFTGKWRQERYRLIRSIGRGATGEVYLAWRGREQVAVKVAPGPTALAAEYERLRTLGEGRDGTRLGPALYELDDAQVGGRFCYFFAMEWVRGLPVDRFVEVRGREWVALCLLRIARLLRALHAHGYAFCDLKPANVLFEYDTASARLIDFGGVTPHGQAVQEFTELFDRAWWGLGLRQADPDYDIVACALLGLHLQGVIGAQDTERLAGQRPERRREWLLERTVQAAAQHGGRGVCGVLADVVAGRLGADEFVGALLQDMGRPQPDADAMESRRRRHRRRMTIGDWALVGAIALFAGTLGLALWLGKL